MRRKKPRREGDWLIKFAIDRFVIFFVRLGLFKPQSSSARKPGAIIGETFTASLRLTRGSSLDLEIALGGVPAKDQPHGLFSPADRCVETSDDVIEDDFIRTPDSRLWDFSPMRLGAVGCAFEPRQAQN